MDSKDLRRALLDLAGRVGYTPDTHDLDDGIDLYKRERVIAGRLKPRSLEVRYRGLRMLSEWRGDADIAGTNWPTEAWEWYAVEGRRIFTALQLLRGVLIIARREGWRNEPHGLGDVLRKAEYLPREAVWTEAQTAEFLAACERLDRADGKCSETSARAREVLRVLALTGCRLREVCNLRFDEIGPGYLRLKDSKTGPRVVPLGEQAQLVLGRQRVTSGFVFPGRWPHKPIGARTVEQAFAVVRKEAGIKDGVVHTLRHNVATYAIRNGVPIQVVQSMLGHATASYVTARYVHLAKRDTALGIAVVENAIRNGGGK